MTAADYNELGIPDPNWDPGPWRFVNGSTSREWTIYGGSRMGGKTATRPPAREAFADENSYKVANARWFGVQPCEACGDETGECDCGG